MDSRRGPWTVVYADGSANVFTFARESAEAAVTVHYEPVTPAVSSSGVYSGGASKDSVLEAADAQRLWALLEQLEHATDGHASQRDKGTGEFTLTVAGKPRRFIVRRGPSLEEFESFVARYRGVTAAGPLVTIVGVARNAKLGALLETDSGTAWVDLPEWPESASGNTVKAMGRWSELADLPVFIEEKGQPPPAGIAVPPGTDLAEASRRKVLVLTEWELVRAP